MALGAGSAFAKFYTCTDPVTGIVTKSDIPCKSPEPRVTDTKPRPTTPGPIAPIVPAARRADWQLLDKYPDEAAHRNAEGAELEVVTRYIAQSMNRLDELKVRRKHLAEEAEFYKGKALPPDLQRAIDASDASSTALRDVFRGLEMDVAHIVAKYDHERDHLRKLWAGAPAGSIGFLVPVAESSPRR